MMNSTFLFSCDIFSVNKTIMASAKNKMATPVRALAAVQINTWSDRKTNEARNAKSSEIYLLDITYTTSGLMENINEKRSLKRIVRSMFRIDSYATGRIEILRVVLSTSY